MEVRVRQGKGRQVEARARFHRIVCDQPFEENGSDTGMTAPELMLASLGACAMHYASKYLETRNLPPHGVEMKVNAEPTDSPSRLAEISIEVEAPGLAPRTREGLVRAIQTCLVSRTLASGVAINVRLTTAVVEAHSALQSPGPAAR